MLAGRGRARLGKHESTANSKDINSGGQSVDHVNVFGAFSGVNEHMLDPESPSPVPEYSNPFGVATFGLVDDGPAFGT